MSCLDIQGNHAHDLVVQFIRDSHETPGVVAHAIELMDTAIADQENCDALLSKHARKWGLSRLALVDRNILRLGTYELRLAVLPHKIVISEALRLAKEFSTTESVRFVNGVLDAIAKDIAGHKTPQEETE